MRQELDPIIGLAAQCRDDRCPCWHIEPSGQRAGGKHLRKIEETGKHLKGNSGISCYQNLRCQ